jgi:hypothetical protein
MQSRALKAVEHYRTPKPGRHSERVFASCVLECGVAAPLYNEIVAEYGGYLTKSIVFVVAIAGWMPDKCAARL